MDFSDISVKLFLIGFLFSFYLVRGQVEPKSSNSSDPKNATSVESPSVESALNESALNESALNKSHLNEALLKKHNEYREIHRVGPLALNSNISKYSQEWANGLAKNNSGLRHRYDNKYGENLYMEYLPTQNAMPDPNWVVQAWYDEVKLYDYNAAEDANDLSTTGHFTQVVWKGTKYLGCGYSRNESTHYVVCDYDPPGNVQGSFQENVLKPKES